LTSFLADTQIKNKSLPEAEALLNAYFTAYKEGWEKTETCMQQDLIWFIFKVILAVQKRWKPFSMDHFEEYYDCVTATLTIKYYTSLPMNWKCWKHATMEDDAESGLPEEIDTDGNKDQAMILERKKEEERQAIQWQS